MAYKVERNNGTGGFSCRFAHGGNKYFAEVRFVPLSRFSECTIYPVDKLDVVYVKWNVPVTREGLLACIEEFKAMLEEEKDGSVA